MRRMVEDDGVIAFEEILKRRQGKRAHLRRQLLLLLVFGFLGLKLDSCRPGLFHEFLLQVYNKEYFDV